MSKIEIGLKEKIHFIGIGGIGMSGLAQVMRTMGFKVQGSDLVNSKNVERCKKIGIKVFKTHSRKNIKDSTIIVKSSAVRNNNPEIRAAKEILDAPGYDWDAAWVQNNAMTYSDQEIEALEDFLPGILKTTTLGYDGKGQYLINSIEELQSLNIDFSKGYILEKLVKLKKEISIIITRFNNHKYEIYEPIENTHEDQILKHSKIPAEINEKIFNQSKEWATLIAEELKYVGTLCVEFFIDRNENLYVNEIAPRVHNSGHLTINAYNISQFENHVRAVCGLKQITLKKLSNAKMINLIGNQISPYRNKSKLNDNEFFFDYLKKEIKEKRKMGHITTLI